MSTRVTRSDLSVDPILADFIEDKALPGTNISAETFWQALSTLAHDFGPRNAELLATRDRMQSELDAWHKAHPGKITDMEAYKGFLSELGYLVPEGEDFQIETMNTDPEFATTPGPQLVVPITNARYALNAANARWGSLYDAFYGTDALGAPAPSGGFDTARGQEVVKAAKAFLPTGTARSLPPLPTTRR